VQQIDLFGQVGRVRTNTLYSLSPLGKWISRLNAASDPQFFQASPICALALVVFFERPDHVLE